MFKFELQSVLDYRLSLEEKAQIAFSEQLRCVENEKRILEDLKIKKAALMHQFLQSQTQQMNASEIAMFISYIRYMIGREQQQASVLAREEAVLEEKRGDLMEAARNRKAMENLKDKKFMQYRADILEKERKELDEFGIVSFQKKVDNEEGDRSL
jgi:flagellar protein FliJ